MGPQSKEGQELKKTRHHKHASPANRTVSTISTPEKDHLM